MAYNAPQDYIIQQYRNAQQLRQQIIKEQGVPLIPRNAYQVAKEKAAQGVEGFSSYGLYYEPSGSPGSQTGVLSITPPAEVLASAKAGELGMSTRAGYLIPQAAQQAPSSLLKTPGQVMAEKYQTAEMIYGRMSPPERFVAHARTLFSPAGWNMLGATFTGGSPQDYVKSQIASDLNKDPARVFRSSLISGLQSPPMDVAFSAAGAWGVGKVAATKFGGRILAAPAVKYGFAGVLGADVLYSGAEAYGKFSSGKTGEGAGTLLRFGSTLGAGFAGYRSAMPTTYESKRLLGAVSFERTDTTTALKMPGKAGFIVATEKGPLVRPAELTLAPRDILKPSTSTTYKGLAFDETLMKTQLRTESLIPIIKTTKSTVRPTEKPPELINMRGTSFSVERTVLKDLEGGKLEVTRMESLAAYKPYQMEIPKPSKVVFARPKKFKRSNLPLYPPKSAETVGPPKKDLVMNPQIGLMSKQRVQPAYSQLTFEDEGVLLGSRKVRSGYAYAFPTTRQTWNEARRDMGAGSLSRSFERNLSYAPSIVNTRRRSAQGMKLSQSSALDMRSMLGSKSSFKFPKAGQFYEPIVSTTRKSDVKLFTGSGWAQGQAWQPVVSLQRGQRYRLVPPMTDFITYKKTPPPSLTLPSFPGGFKTRHFRAFGRQPRQYSPSLYSQIFNVRGKRPKGLLSGVEIRPLINSGSRGKRRKRGRKL